MTVSNIDCDYDGYADSGSNKFETGTTISVAVAAVTNRAHARFPLAAITAGSTINDSDIQFNVTAEAVEVGSEGATIHAYNGTGDDDPDPDTGADAYSRAAGGSGLVNIDCNGTGTKTGDLTATADGQIQGNLSSPGFYAVGLVPWNLAATDSISIEAIENAGTDPATLIVDWTAPAAATLRLRTLMGAGS